MPWPMMGTLDQWLCLSPHRLGREVNRIYLEARNDKRCIETRMLI